jgi:CRP-like cAMP-binding protein
MCLDCLRILHAHRIVAAEMTNDRIKNRVLQHLARTSPGVHAQLVAQLEPIFLERGVVLGIARNRTESVYFLESGVVSLIASTRSGNSLEVAVVGREGVAGIADALGQRPLPYGWVVQLSGLAYRAPTALVRDHILSCSALHELLMACSQLMMHQLAQSAVCNRFHTSEQRLSRWLLLTAERAGTMRFELTHEFVGQMVGAPRSAVSQAAASLRRKGIIEYRRGVMTIRNAERLRKTSCECFDAVSMDGDTQSGQSGVTLPGDTQG